MHTFLVPEESDGIRIDGFIFELLRLEHSRTQIQKAIKNGNCTINNKKVSKVSTPVVWNTTVRIHLEIPAEPTKVEPENIPLEILYEDDDMMVISKPSGMCVHPDHCYRSGTVVNALLHYLDTKNISSLGGSERPGIVHRLDKDTSGCLMIAKNDEMHRYLSEMIATRKVEKKYTALVFGRLRVEKGTIDAPIARNPQDRQKMTVLDSHTSKSALTHFETKALYAEPLCSLVDVQIITGRTHQIRVHFQSIGHPVVNDTMYGMEKENLEFMKSFPLQRIFLHARNIKIPMPDGKILDITAPYPVDIDKSLHMLDIGTDEKF